MGPDTAGGFSGNESGVDTIEVLPPEVELKLKLQYFGHLVCKELTHWKRLRARGEGGGRG